MFCYFDNITKLKNVDFNNILLYKNLQENILIYGISWKSLNSAKALHIMFDKVNRFIRDYNGTKYLALFGSEKYNAIFLRISSNKNQYFIYCFL